MAMVKEEEGMQEQQSIDMPEGYAQENYVSMAA